MKTVRNVLCCLLALMPSTASSDACSDLKTAIEKAATLRGAMQREAAPLLNLAQMPTQHVGACNAAQAFRDHVVMLAKLDDKCLSDEDQKNLTATIVSSMREANNNIGLFCN
jgi:hypothetical protein